jgi:hypothetical protein
MTFPAPAEPVLIPASAPLQPVLAAALAAEMPDAVVGRWPGGPVWLPCGHPSAAIGANRFQVEPGSRPDLAHEVRLDLPAGTLVARGTFVAVGPPGHLPMPRRCVLTLPDDAAAVDHPVEPTDHDTFASGIEALAGLLEYESSRPGYLATVSSALDVNVFETLFTYFDQVHEQALSPEQCRAEAGAWRQLVLSRWPLTSPDTHRVLAALNLLAATSPAAVVAPGDDPPAVPGNELQAMLIRLQHDPALRPRLWPVLHRSTVHFAVPAYDLVPGRHAELSLLGAPVQGTRHAFGFTSAEGLARVLDDAGGSMVSVEATGEELTRFWPADQWLVLDPGGPLATVIEPAEVRCLPYGPRHGVPHPDSVHVIAPEPDQVRDGRLAALGAGIDAVTAIRLAVLVDKASGSTQLVAAVAVSDQTRVVRTLAVMADRAAFAGVGGLLAVPDTDENPLAGPLRRDGLLVYRRAVDRGAGR